MNPTVDRSSPETLRAALRRAADDLHRHAPAAELPAAVQAAAVASRRGSPRRMAWAAGLALAMLALAAGLLASAPREPDPLSPAQVATPFLPVGASDRWAQLLRDSRDHGPAWVVPAELPRESLAAMGLPYDAARAGEPVRAELLVHASGDVLAVRFVR